MKSARFRHGTKKWKHVGHKPKAWYLSQYGTSGNAIYQRREGK